MARRNSAKTLSIVASVLSIITCAGLLSNTERCSEIIEVTSNETDLYKDYHGWHLVTDANQLKNGDQIIFVGQDDVENFFIMDKDFKGIKGTYSYDSISKNGVFSVNESTMKIYTIVFDNLDKVSFKTTNGYLASDKSFYYNSNLNESCIYDLSFVDNKVLLKNYNSSVLNYKNNYFNLSLSSDCSYPLIFKWYGKDEAKFEYSADYEFMYNFTDYSIVSATSYKLKDGDVVCPILTLQDTYYVPINVTLPACGDCNAITDIDFYEYGIGSDRYELSFYNVDIDESGDVHITNLMGELYNPHSDCTTKITFKHYLDDYDTWRTNNCHSSYLAYYNNTYCGELGFYICPDYDDSDIKYCHFGSSSRGIDGDKDKDGLIGMYGQIDYWLVKK